MQSLAKIEPIKLQILGDYWDSYLYKGRLYLWTMYGSIKVINWDMFIDNLTTDPKLYKTIECAFKQGDYLYSDKNRAQLYETLNFRDELKVMLQKINTEHFVFESSEIDKFLIQEIENPFKELPVDSDVYFDSIYSIFDDGLSKVDIDPASENALNKNSLSTLWDCPAYSLKIKSGRIALSAGEEGLFEYKIKNINPKKRSDEDEYNVYVNYNGLSRLNDNVTCISSSHSLFANWSYSSVFNSSDFNGSCLVGFLSSKGGHVEYINTYDEDIIFRTKKESRRLSWGSDDKIYREVEDGLEVVHFVQGDLLYDRPFSRVEKINFMPWKGKIVSAGLSFFGTIVECENALVVLQSDGNINNIVGPITKWRVFPRSVRYENQLHVIQEDRLEIFSFNHDYFIKQYNKKYGIKKRINFNKYLQGS